jgi:hypothetical protein
MSRYGLNRYNLAYYGSSDANPFIATNFTARSKNYGYIGLSWNSPYGQWSRIKLVRNSYGFPNDAWDGVELDIKNDGNYFAFKETDPASYDDKTNLGYNAFYYYSLFVYSTVSYSWVRVGDVSAVSAKDYGYTDLMYNSLPEVHKVTSLGDPMSNLYNDDLYNFLSLFGFQLSLMNTYTNLLTNRYNVESVGGALMPTFMQEFGVTYEPEVGLQQSRILLQNIATVLKEKGSRDGLQEYLKVYSGYPISTINTSATNPASDGFTVGKNLMLDYNDSSFEESIGHWSSSDSSASLYCLKQRDVKTLQLTSNVAVLNIGAHSYNVGNKVFTNNFSYPLFNSGLTAKSITAVTSTTISFALTGSDIALTGAYNNALGVYPTVSPDPYGWPEPSALTAYPNRQKGILAIRNAGTSTATLKASCGYSNAITKGVPVTAGLAYSFSIYSVAGSTTRTITVGIDWYDRFGVYISSSTGSGTSNAAGEFSVRLSAANKTAPSSAYYAVPTISIASSAGSASNEWHYFDCSQMEQSTTVTSFEEARLIKVIYKANRINELINPNFDSVATPWTATGGSLSILNNVAAPGSIIYPADYLTISSGTAKLESRYSNDFKAGQSAVIKGVTGITDGVYTVIANGASTSSSLAYITFSYSGTLARTAVAGTFYISGSVLKVSPTTTTAVLKSWNGSTTSQQMGIYNPGADYTFSVYSQGSTTSETITLSITWYDSSYTLISTATGSTLTVTKLITGTSWDRPYVTATAPSTAAYAIVTATLTTSNGSDIRFDKALFEQNSFALPFFSGDTGSAASTDLIWEGTAAASRSHYYHNYSVTTSRLLYGALDDYLLLGTSLSIAYAQPKT